MFIEELHLIIYTLILYIPYVQTPIITKLQYCSSHPIKIENNNNN